MTNHNAQEAQRRAVEAKRKLDEQKALTGAGVSGHRPDMTPIDQADARAASERQLAVQETAEEQEAKALAVANANAVQEALDNASNDTAANLAAVKPKKGEKLIEVLLERKYAPKQIANEDGEMVDQTGISQTLPAGTTVKLPLEEALRAMQNGIAKPTNNAFEE